MVSHSKLEITRKLFYWLTISNFLYIVVLIILAGVLINISLGNNGLFNKAKTAKEMYVNAQEYEDTEIAKTANQIDEYAGGLLVGGREYLNVKSGTYVGTGEAGSSHPSTLTFQEAPQIIIISTIDYTHNVTCFFIQGSNYSSCGISGNLSDTGLNCTSALEWSNGGKTVKWYSNGNPGDQLNRENITYKWVAIF